MRDQWRTTEWPCSAQKKERRFVYREAGALAERSTTALDGAERLGKGLAYQNTA